MSGYTYVQVLQVVNLITQMVIAGALVSIAVSLYARNKK